ncbi:hypothetical protein P8935_16060 [Telmatobacter sp. DSM 110680]|uniref:PilZ domain-containing protein n=1 Tax=Telmatobacter sp. DSM 110680 TaxID=3036704 RepID=A0AAU7DG02_9BACT
MQTEDNTAEFKTKVTSIHAGARERLVKRLTRWLCPEQRAANRLVAPPLIAYLGTVRGSKEFRIGDFSVSGFYMITEERWIAGTSFPVTLERTDPEGMGRSFTVTATVVRAGEDGIGFSFVPPATDEYSNESGGTSSTLVDLTQLAQFLNGLPLTQCGAEALKRAS